MPDWTERTEMLVGAEAVGKLLSSRVAVVGVGGVGSVAAEMLVRAGVAHIHIIDSDVVSETNINRQIIALRSTIGKSKCTVVMERLLDINPSLDITVTQDFLSESNVEEILGGSSYDYVVDAIDTLSPKIALAQFCLSHGLSLVSSMGSGGKYDATSVRVADISKTYECPLARMMRKRLHKLGIEKGYLAVFSPEIPDKAGMTIEETRNKKSQVGTVSYLPAVFGCVCAQVVIKSIIGKN